MKKADLLDRKILRIISIDARRSFKEIAAHCGVSRAAIHQRVVRMIEKGIITGSGYQVSPKFLGFGTCTYIGIKLERGSMYKQTVDQLNKIPVLVKLYSRDNEHLKDLLNNKIQEIPGVTSTETMISLEQSISRTVPILFEVEDYLDKNGPLPIHLVDEVED